LYWTGWDRIDLGTAWVGVGEHVGNTDGGQ
jgi:hypothetical protein